MTNAVLKSLTIRDFALVPALDIAFDDGLTVVTGESGAGKSILLGALGLVLGERAASDTVRPGAARADISAEFDLSDHAGARQLLEAQAVTDPDQPSRCLVRRVVGADGRSRAFVNGSPVTLQVLRTLTQDLVDVHGQHENQRIAEPAVQLALLDDYGVESKLRRDCRDAYRAWRGAEREVQELEERVARQDDRARLIGYQLDELQALALEPGELEAIESEHRRLSQAEALRGSVADCLNALEEESAAGTALRRLGSLNDDHARLESARSQLESALDLMNDAARDLRAYDESLDLDPERLQALEARLSAIHDTARRHRLAPEQLEPQLEALRAEQAELSDDRASLEAARGSAVELRERFLERARRLSKQRRRAARQFEKAVSGCMETLGIRGGKLSLVFGAGESETGLETVAFHVTTNPRYPAGLLQRIASGGERARIGLAIQVVAAEKSAMPCLVLDEADVGVGGTTADVVGRLLRDLAANTQVICVTHAPQVAALGHNHLRVTKTDDQDTCIEGLAVDSRIEELARMLAGADITDKSRDYARTLLAEAGR